MKITQQQRLRPHRSMIDRQMRGIVPSSAWYTRFNRSIDEGKNEL
jgi:hypothetical protein